MQTHLTLSGFFAILIDMEHIKEIAQVIHHPAVDAWDETVYTHKFVADDGRVFNSKTDCINHEAAVRRKQEQIEVETILREKLICQYTVSILEQNLDIYRLTADELKKICNYHNRVGRTVASFTEYDPDNTYVMYKSVEDDGYIDFIEFHSYATFKQTITNAFNTVDSLLAASAK